MAGGTATIVEPSAASFSTPAVVVAGGQVVMLATVANDNGGGVNWIANAGGTFSLTNTPRKTPTTYTAPSLGSASFLVVTITAQQPGVNGGSNGTAASYQLIVAANLKLLPTAQLSVMNNSLTATGFVFRIRGFTKAGLTFGVVGVFTMDGAGNIPSGFEDINIANADGSSSPFTKVAFTGSYSMATPSNGAMTLTVTNPPWTSGPNSPPTTMAISFTLSEDTTFGYMIEADVSGAYAGSGDFAIQDPTTADFSTSVVTGSYVFLISGPAGSGTSAIHKGVIGRFVLGAETETCESGSITGTADDQSGAPTQTLGGCYAIDTDTSGHGTFNIVAGTSTPAVSFYIVSPGALYALETDANAAGSNSAIQLGVVRKIAGSGSGVGPPFDSASLTGPSVFHLLGITNNGHSSVAVGVLSGTASSSTTGTLAGEYDANDGGTIPPGAPLPLSATNATFTIASDGNGRGKLSIISNGVTYNFVFYLRSKLIGFLLEQPASDASNRGRSGRWFPQNPVPGGFLKGGIAFISGSYADTAAALSNTAVLTVTGPDSSGNFAGPSYSSKAGTTPQLPESVSPAGTYAVSATDPNQRATVTATTGKIAGSASVSFYADFIGEFVGIGTDALNQEPQVIFLDQ